MRLDQVCLAEAHAAIDEERVVRRRVLGNLQSGGAGQLVCLAGDERRERESRIEACLLVAPRQRRGSTHAGGRLGGARGRGSF